NRSRFFTVERIRGGLASFVASSGKAEKSMFFQTEGGTAQMTSSASSGVSFPWSSTRTPIRLFDRKSALTGVPSLTVFSCRLLMMMLEALGKRLIPAFAAKQLGIRPVAVEAASFHHRQETQQALFFG